MAATGPTPADVALQDATMPPSPFLPAPIIMDAFPQMPPLIMDSLAPDFAPPASAGAERCLQAWKSDLNNAPREILAQIFTAKVAI
tara:strand:+ start:184 stop:441 length:258 start_codon:yes stop_codon:yes gene_type:complete